MKTVCYTVFCVPFAPLNITVRMSLEFYFYIGGVLHKVLTFRYIACDGFLRYYSSADNSVFTYVLSTH